MLEDQRQDIFIVLGRELFAHFSHDYCLKSWGMLISKLFFSFLKKSSLEPISGGLCMSGTLDSDMIVAAASVPKGLSCNLSEAHTHLHSSISI